MKYIIKSILIGSIKYIRRRWIILQIIRSKIVYMLQIFILWVTTHDQVSNFLCLMCELYGCTKVRSIREKNDSMKYFNTNFDYRSDILIQFYKYFYPIQANNLLTNITILSHDYVDDHRSITHLSLLGFKMKSTNPKDSRRSQLFY